MEIGRAASKPNWVIDSNPRLKKQRDEQNKRMQRKLLRIVVSDLLCWIPVSIMAFCRLAGQVLLAEMFSLFYVISFVVAGVDIPLDSYLPVGLIIIPINSALNPFLYSDLPDVIWNKLEPARNLFHTYCYVPLVRIYRGKSFHLLALLIIIHTSIATKK